MKSTTRKPKTVKTEAVEATVAVKPVKKVTGSLSVDVYDLTGKVADSYELPKEIFGVRINKTVVAQTVRVILANQREGSASTKTRGEVQGSTRKIYRQKGTGRARHGGVRAPVFVHGGIAHGPKPHDFSMKMPQKMKRAALFSTLTAKVTENAVIVVDGIEKIEAKTKIMAQLLKQINGDKKQGKVLFVLDGKQTPVVRAVRNIADVTYEFANQLNAYEVLQYRQIIFMKNAIDVLKKTFLK